MIVRERLSDLTNCRGDIAVEETYHDVNDKLQPCLVLIVQWFGQNDFPAVGQVYPERPRIRLWGESNETQRSLANTLPS